MNNTQLAIKIKSVTRQGDYETQLAAIEKLLNEHRPEQLFKHGVSGSLLADTRQAVADYMRSEGCSCCQDREAHKEHEKRLAELLKVEMYDDESGYDFGKYRSKQ